MIKKIIERPIAVTMSVIAIIVLGLLATSYLPISLMPNVDIPTISVQVSAPGMSVREVNDNILNSLKYSLNQVEGIKHITSEARSDAGVITMSFEPGCNIDIIFIQINERLDRVSLPKDIERPKVIKASATDIPAFYLNVSLKKEARQSEQEDLPKADVDFVDLGNFARDVLAKRIEQLSETAMVDISGVVNPELLCIPDYKKLTSMGVGVELLENSIKSNNVSIGALSIKDGQYRHSIEFDSRITTKKDIENIRINHNGRIYLFNELCEIVERPKARDGLIRNGNNNCISMAIIKQSEARMDDLQKSIDELIKAFVKENPNLEFELTRDQTKLLTYSINNLKSNMLFGAILACFIIFLFMRDLRSPMLIIVTIPLSIIVTLLVFHFVGISLNIISLSGLILGLGMMVDNSIIVIENIAQKWRNGAPLNDAIEVAVREVFTPMLSSVLTTCSVFIPLIFLSGTAGALFFDQAMAVTISLFASLMVAVLVLPVYYYAIYKKKDARTENRFMAKYLNFNYYKPYEKAISWSLRHRFIVLFFFMLSIPLTYVVYNLVEKSRMPTISHDDVMITIDWNSGISLEENDKRVFDVMEQVKDLTTQSTSMIGLQQFVMSHTKDITTSEAVVYVKAADNESIVKVENIIKEYFKEKYPNALCTFGVSGNIFDMIFSEGGYKLVAQLHSKDGKAPTVGMIRKIIDTLSVEMPNVYISPLITEENIRYVADADAMAMYNVTYGDISSKMRNMISQNSLFRINQGNYYIPVTTGEKQTEAEDMLEGKVRNRDGVDIPLSLLIKETRGEDFKKLFSDSSGDYYPICIDVPDQDIKSIINTIERVVKDEGTFFVDFKGEYFSSRDMIKELIIILIVAISLLYFILAAQFESIVQPIIILSEIIIDVFFVLLGLWILGESLNIMSLIGLVVVSGIIINDSILKVDTINRLRRNGMSVLRAIIEGGHSRLKPIIMTSLTTILAIVPFLNRVDMGSDLQFPLSLTIIIGMTIGTIVSLIFIPVVYYTIYRNK